MAITSRTDLKALFIKGVIPSQSDFESLIDSAFNLNPADNQINNLTLVSSPASGANFIIQQTDGSFARVTWGNLPDGGGGGGETNNGANVGVSSDIELFDGKPLLDLEFRGIKLNDNNLASSYDSGNKQYNLTVNTTNLKSNLALDAVENYVQLRQAANRWATAFSEATSIADDTRFLVESQGASYAKRYIKKQNMPYAAKNPALVTKTADFSLDNTHDNKMLQVSGSTTITLEPSLTDKLWCIVSKEDASNEIDFAEGTGVTIKSSGLKLTTQYAAATVYHAGSNVFYVWGNLST